MTKKIINFIVFTLFIGLINANVMEKIHAEVGIATIDEFEGGIRLDIYLINKVPVAGVQFEIQPNDLFKIDSISGGICSKVDFSLHSNDKGLLLGHPTLEGGNVLNFEDSNGKAVGKAIIAVAKYGEVNEVDLMIARLTTDDEKLYKKTQLVTRVADLICAVGFYSE